MADLPMADGGPPHGGLQIADCGLIQLEIGARPLLTVFQKAVGKSKMTGDYRFAIANGGQ